MTKLFVPFLFILFSLSSAAQSNDERAIRKILADQTQAWNNGNLEEFMSGYWKSDSLMFIGKSGITYGWQKTLDNYRRGYPDRTAMGTLSFDILQVQRISGDHFFVVGKWNLKRTIGDLSGHYTLIWKKINGEWKVVSDHSS